MSATAAKRPFTIAHVTHEAVEQLGGIGTVLEGLMISPVYQKAVGRSILVGPTSAHATADPEARLGEHGKVLYSSVDGIDRHGLAGKFKPIEWAFNVKIIYGTRSYDHPGEGRKGQAEVLLIDVSNVNPERLNQFKTRAWETLGIDSLKYESSWDFEEYARLAEPAHYSLRALLRDEELPCILFAHEFMGLPAAFSVILDGQKQFRTVFHAHECATARRIVENHPGHDTMFYNVLELARQQGMYVEDVFGSRDAELRHALVSRSYLCDGIIAVGDKTKDELKFLNKHFDHKTVDLVYNGIPAGKVDLKIKNASRKLLAAYSKILVGFEPHVIATHVTRPVVSKGLWRDLKVFHELDGKLGLQKKTGVLYILTSAGGVRRPQDVASMEERYGWPRNHRSGYPDLVGPEEELHADIENYNREHTNTQVVLVNQFGWSQARIGQRLPTKMDIADFRHATDIEFGMATYEPFGISPLEPLGAGAICVISNVCGCEGFVQYATGGNGTPNVITADYTKLGKSYTIEQLKTMTAGQRDQIEAKVAAEVADTLMSRLPWNDQARESLIKAGQLLVAKMGWDQIIGDGMLPLLERIRTTPNGNGG